MKSHRGSAQGSTGAAQGAALVLTPATPVQAQQCQGLKFGWNLAGAALKVFILRMGHGEAGACQNFIKTTSAETACTK